MDFWIVNITSFCNQKCVFCSEWDMHNNPKNIPFDKVISILTDLKNNGVEGVNFMWGECTMRSDLGDILDFCRKNFKFVSIVTNGVMFMNPLLAKKILSKVQIFEYSWHTTHKEKFNKLSWSETFEFFQKWLQNVANELKENLHLWIIINHVINKINFEDIPEFVRTAAETLDLADRKNRLIALKRTNLVWYSVKNKEDLSVCPSQVLPYLYSAIEYCIKNKVYVQIEWFPPCYFSDFFDSEYFQVNEMDETGLYLLNKIDISNVQDVSVHKQMEEFSSKAYKRWNVALNVKILEKCRKCIFRKKCHLKILLSEDANVLTENIVSVIWNTPIVIWSIEDNIKKRESFLEFFAS